MTRVGFLQQKGASVMVAELTNWNVEFVAQLSAKAHRVSGGCNKTFTPENKL